jgi:hypothetical protein
MGRGDDPGKMDRVATVEALNEKEKGIIFSLKLLVIYFLHFTE